MQTQTPEALLDAILHAHQAWFDVQRNHLFAGRLFPGYAEFHAHGEQYVLVKRAKLWEAEAHQYLFFDIVEHLDSAYLEQALDFMKTKALAKVHPEPNHMCSDLGLVLVAQTANDDALRMLKRTRWRKSFALGIRGWSDLKLATVDMSDGRIAANGAGDDLVPMLRGACGLQEQTSRAAGSWRTVLRGRSRRQAMRTRRPA